MKNYQTPTILTYVLDNEDVVTVSTALFDNYGGWNAAWDEIFDTGVEE